MYSRDSFRCRGILTVTRLYRADRMLHGKEMYEALRRGEALTRCQCNIVVDLGLSAISRLLGGGANSPTVGGTGVGDINEIAVGKMEIGNTVTPPTPAAGDTTGVGALVYTPPLVVTYPSATSVLFSGLVPATELNGTTLTEEALKLKNGKLFAKTIFSEPKTSSFGLQFDHEIIIERG